jgi:Flp pilus assembly protein TadG
MINAIRSFSRKLSANSSGIALTEFAAVAPVFLTLGMFGFEVANLATSKMRVSQIAMSLADNASRLGQTDNSSVSPTVTEDEVEAVLKGALLQGASINLEANGRLILSSLEYDVYTDKQYIHWQRCVGSATRASQYGDEGTNNGLSGASLPGMGTAPNVVVAPQGSAVMYVELVYTYTPVFASPFGKSADIVEEAAFIVRDDRDIGEYDEKGLAGTKKNGC